MKRIKKPLALMLTLILTLSIIPFSALTVNAETVKMGYIFETNVNIRKDATTQSEKVANVSKKNVSVLDSKKDVNSSINPNTKKTYIWYQVSFTANSETIKGYVREDLIKVTEYKPTPNSDFEEALKEFPESYREALTLLHKMYPNWKFIADKIPMSFTSAVAAQDKEFTKLVLEKHISWRSMREGCYDWDKQKFITTDGGRYGASREVIAYYMDPRNFLNANDIFVFMQQSYDNKTQTLEGVQQILEGTFLEGTITNKEDKFYKKPYAGVIRYAASQSGVNAYVLASTIIQEQGVKGGTLGKGTTYKDKKVYNHFNFSASGSTKEEIIKNGAKFAYKNEWFTPTESIVGGAKKYGLGYINVGQDTYYYKNFNVLDPDKLWHQYAQNIADSINSSKRLQTTYADLKDIEITFRIPVYKSLPSKISKLTSPSDKLNNYYFETLEANGLSPKFNRYTTEYSLTTDGNAEIYFELPENATYEGENSYPLKKGENKITLKVKSQTGITRKYTVNITAKTDGVLNIIQKGGTLVRESDGKWYYYVGDKKAGITSLVKYSGKWFYVKDGIWTKQTGLIKHSGQWFYVKGGIWKKHTGLIKYSGKWFYLENGKWKNNVETLTKHKGKWLYVYKGKWDSKSKKTLVKYSGKWFYVKKGKRATDTLIFKFKDKKFYIKKGIAQLDFTGKKTINNKTYKIKNGKVI